MSPLYFFPSGSVNPYMLNLSFLAFVWLFVVTSCRVSQGKFTELKEDAVFSLTAAALVY